MAKRSKITTLPREVREWLDAALVEGNFSGYEQLAHELAERGVSIGKSSIHRYGAQLEQRLAAIKASTEAAKLIAAQSPDDADDRSAAVISMIQTETFDTLVRLQDSAATEDPVKRAAILGKVAKNVATLTRANVTLNRYRQELRAKAEAAAKAAAGIARKGGLSGDAVAQIRAQILGIAG